MTTSTHTETPGRKGLLVMAYGTPATNADIEAFYTHIRHGRAPEPAQLDELTARYESLGGTSPLAANTNAQLAELAAALGDSEAGIWSVALGQKHAAPFIEDGVEQLLAEGATTIVGVVLAPHYSHASIGDYHQRATSAITSQSGGTPPGYAGVETPPSYVGIDSWHLLEELLEFQRSALVEALEPMPERTKVIFTAHSLPEKLLAGDPYPDQLHESASLIAARAGIATWAGWGLGWQSKGRTPDPWRGPDVLEIIDDLADTGRSDGILVVPQGFTSDHLEVLYDLDIEARRAAESRGLAFTRTAVPNADPTVMTGLANLARAHRTGPDSPRSHAP